MSLSLFLTLSTFSSFPAWRTESQAGDRGGARSNRASVYVNGSLAVVPSCSRLLRPTLSSCLRPPFVRFDRLRIYLRRSEVSGEVATYRASTFTLTRFLSASRICLLCFIRAHLRTPTRRQPSFDQSYAKLSKTARAPLDFYSPSRSPPTAQLTGVPRFAPCESH